MSGALDHYIRLISKMGPELEDQLIRDQCRDSLHYFVREFWDVVEPGRPFVDNWHLHWICDELQAITDGNTTRLLLNVPPGAMKSLLMVFWTAYEWGPRNMPSLRYLSASYSQNLTIRDNRRRKAILMDEKYRRLWPHVRIDPNRTSDENFGNTRTGWCIATSTGGVGTGERADRVICLPEYAMILTDLGWFRIGDVIKQKMQVEVAGWNGNDIIWQQIEAYETNPGRSLCEIVFDGGNIRCTEDHLVWTDERGYVPAIEVRVGESVRTYGIQTLRTMRRDDSRQAEPHCEAQMVFKDMQGESRTRTSASKQLPTVPQLWSTGLSHPGSRETNTQRTFLQSCLSWFVEHWFKQPGPYRYARCHLRMVFKAIPQTAKKTRVLFAGMRNRANKSKNCFRMGDRSNLPGMSETIPSKVQGATVLHTRLCCHGACEAHEEQRQWTLSSWTSRTSISTRMVEYLQGTDQGAGWSSMLSVWHVADCSWSSVRRASYQLPQTGFGPDEPNNAMSFLPRQNARSAKSTDRMRRATVRAVTRLDERPQVTYNLRVSPCHNYFADGILVHNCDDPHSVRTSDSDAIREQTLHWWREVIPTRVNDPQTSAFVVVMQRVHEDDVSADILDNRGPEWTYVMIPMRYEPDRHCTTAHGDDPRTEPGELYWPERFPEWTVARDEIPLGRYGVAAQFQQLPAPRGGGIILREWWQLWPPHAERDQWTIQVYDEDRQPRTAIKFPDFDFVMAYVDTAFTSKEENAYCAFVRFAVFGDSAGRPRVMMAGAWRDKPTLRQLCLKIMDSCRVGKVDALVIENKAGAEWVKQEMQRLMRAGEFQIILDEPRGDKVARLHQVAPLFEDGVVYAPDKHWSDMVIQEVATFPKGKYADLTDCVSGGLGYLRRNDLIKLSVEHDEDEREARVFRGNRPGIARMYEVG